METQCGSYDEEICIGPFGGTGGKDFSYKNKTGVIKIAIIYNDNVVESITFKGYNDTEYSKTVVGVYPCCEARNKINIDFPSDFLTGVSGTYGPAEHYAYETTYIGDLQVIKSIKFYTKNREYGPFGCATGSSFSFRQKGGLITGFHGKWDQCLRSLGIYIKPLSSMFVSIPKEEHSEHIMLQPNNIVMINKSLLLRNPGPWGSTNGRLFDDGVFSDINQIHVHACSSSNAISAIQFQYLKKDGTTIWSTMHGAPCADIVKKIEMNEDEYLVGIEGFYCQSMIRSLKFHTNKGKYGPVGSEIGEFFTSYYACNGKIVGFFGKSGACLNAIGVHNEYL